MDQNVTAVTVIDNACVGVVSPESTIVRSGVSNRKPNEWHASQVPEKKCLNAKR